MGRIKKNIILFFSILLIGGLLIIIFTNNYSSNWVYDLPNNYKLRKVSNVKYEIGLDEGNDLITRIDDKEIGLQIYVAEFQYSDSFIGLKSAREKDDSLIVEFYIIDTINKNLYGPYLDEMTYLAVQGTIMNGESFNEFIDTTKNVEGTYYK